MLTITQASESGPTSDWSGLGAGGMALAVRLSNGPAAQPHRWAAIQAALYYLIEVIGN